MEDDEKIIIGMRIRKGEVINAFGMEEWERNYLEGMSYRFAGKDNKKRVINMVLSVV